MKSFPFQVEKVNEISNLMSFIFDFNRYEFAFVLLGCKNLVTNVL